MYLLFHPVICSCLAFVPFSVKINLEDFMRKKWIRYIKQPRTKKQKMREYAFRSMISLLSPNQHKRVEKIKKIL